MDEKILEKTTKIIESCRTREQLKTANKFAELVNRIDSEIFEQCKEPLILKEKQLTVIMNV